jgi:uncharacterized membrane protein
VLTSRTAHRGNDRRVTDPTDNAPPPPVGAPLPNTTSEGVTLLAHFYRGEVARVISWRDRLDRTTNWAIGALAAMLSIALATENSHHSVLLFAMLLIHVMLFIEARRYRFFHVYRARLRLFETRYLAAALDFDENNKRVALDEIRESLRVPRFTITMTEAMSRRLRRNYCWIFLVVLLAWLVKTTSHFSQGRTRLVHSIGEFLQNASIAGIAGAAVIAGVAAMYAWLIFVTLRYKLDEDDLGPGNVHV